MVLPGEAATSAKGRSTRQKAAVNRVLDELDGFVSARELHARLRERCEQVSLTTVYRILQQQQENGAVDVLHREDHEAVFRRCAAEEHHYHLVCRSCGAAVEVQAPEIERWAARVAGESGFTRVEHTVEIYGVCPTCSSCR
jgi:Fur family ferric uptake transcriptional regulator